MKRKKNLYLTGTYILLTVLAVIWLIPIIWIFLTSFRGEGANAVPYFFPKTYTFNNYIKLFTSDAYPFGKLVHQYFHRCHMYMYPLNFDYRRYGLLT